MENSKIGMIVLSVLCVILLAFTIASYTTRYSENYVLTYAGGKIAEAQEKHNTQLNAIQETLNIQITELEGTLATLQEEKASIETQLTELEASLTAEQAAHATEIADLQEQLEVIDEEIEEVESEIIHLVDELALANSFEYLAPTHPHVPSPTHHTYVHMYGSLTFVRFTCVRILLVF